MNFEILQTDQVFYSSPNTGAPDCKCSRCGNLIPEKESPILRCWPTEPDDIGYDPKSKGGTEFRYCWSCSKKAGIDFGEVEDDEEFSPEFEHVFDVRKCRLCGCTDNDCRQCIKKTGQPCHWVEIDLCSACVEKSPITSP